MEFLPGEGLLQHLASLQKLYIWSFDSLQCLPEEGLPPSVSFLKSTDVLPWRKVVRRKTYGRRLSQDSSHSFHMDRQRPDHMSTLSFGNTFVFCHFTLNSQTEVRTQGLFLESFSYASFPNLPITARGGGLIDHYIRFVFQLEQSSKEEIGKGLIRHNKRQMQNVINKMYEFQKLQALFTLVFFVKSCLF